MNHYFDELINKRRSIRKYQSNPPPDEWIGHLINCASQAPSASNRQPVRFVRIVSDPKKQLIRNTIRIARDHLLSRIEMQGLTNKLKNKVNAYYRYSDFMFDAPWLFAVGADKTDTNDFNRSLISAGLSGNFELNSDDISIGMALQSFLLKATELGLGACVLTGPLIFVPDICKMPDFSNISLKCFIAVGFPDETPEAPPQIKVLDIYSEI
ncbi:MAG: nitroreductase [Candidatus Magnetoglobus multicellularis str. Araruama]|uniref:Nitroreductase n=1 Tax=Candidatus Magnetoglobus multicellularis str. Araruama TaxID=890399 RepID=A0A1V1PA62_9BACT|nr:MAG: nitroreductase [Candidatus Magnetoglobus multicellularis str. Araruama]